MKRHVTLLACAIFITACASEQDHRPKPVETPPVGIEWSAPIPPAPESMPLLQLSVPPAPIDLLNRVLAGATGKGKLTSIADAPLFRENHISVPRDVLGMVEKDHLRAYIDRRSGEVAFFPNLSALAALRQVDEQRAVAAAEEIFRAPAFLVSDDTRVAAGAAQVLNGETARRDNDKTQVSAPKAAYLVYVPARRFVGDYAVYGPGSRAVVAVGNDGVVEGLTRTWKVAKEIERISPQRRPDDVRHEIERQLAPAAKDSRVTIETVDLAYYDGNRELLQPAYRFIARIHHVTQQPRTADDFVIGFVPIAATREPIPSLSDADGPTPEAASNAPQKSAKASAGAGESVLDPIVGRYVVRNDTQSWVNNANAFWNGINLSFAAASFSNAQYYWAEPRLFTSQKDFFVNSVNLALIEVHGDWWLYSTEKNCCDLVNIDGDIPSPGYGPSANGVLADWVIHSCEVVPSPDDTATWPDPWWTVFGGVRNVVGYRTIMYISDGADFPYGLNLAFFAPVVGSWLNTVSSLNAYAGGPKRDAHGGISRPMGRASTISACGHDGDTVFNVSRQARANCLTVWWFPD